MDKILRAVVSGSRLFNTLFGLPHTGKNTEIFRYGLERLPLCVFIGTPGISRKTRENAEHR